MEGRGEGELTLCTKVVVRVPLYNGMSCYDLSGYRGALFVVLVFVRVNL